MLSKRLFYFLTPLAVALLAIFKQDIPILQFILLAYGVIAFAILIPLPKTLQFLSARLLVAVLLSAVLFQVEALLFWALHIHVTGVVYVLSLFLATNAALAFLIYKNRTNEILTSSRSLKPSLADLAVIIPAVLICGTILFGDFRSGKDFQGSVIRSIGFGVDDAAHDNMFGDAYRAHDNMILGKSVPYVTVNGANNPYPKGSYIDSVIYASALSGQKNHQLPVIKLVDAYFVAKNVMLFLTIATFSLLLWMVAALFDKDNKDRVRNVFFVVTFSGLISSILTVTLWWQGFFSFLPTIIYGLLFAAFVLAKDRQQTSNRHFFYMSLCVIGATLTWLLAAPALFISLLLFLPKPSSWKLTPAVCLAYIRQNIFRLSMALVCFFILCFQFYAEARWSIGVNAIIAPGGISLPPQLLAVAIFLTLLAFLFRRSHSHEYVRSVMVRWLIPLLIWILIVLLFECLKGQGASYYFYKMEYLLLIFSSIATFGFLLEQFNTRANASRNQPAEPLLYQLALFAMLVGTVFLVTTDFGWMKTFLDQVRGERELSVQTGQLIAKSLDEPFSVTNARVFVVLPKDLPESIVGTDIANSGHSTDLCYTGLYNAVYAPDIVSAFTTELKTCLKSPGGPKYVIYTDTTTQALLDANLKNAIASNRLTIGLTQ